MTYEALMGVAWEMGYTVKEKNLWAYDGRIKGKNIAIRKSIRTSRRKACVLAEEIGHDVTGCGNVMDGSVMSDKLELRARSWAYDLQIGLAGLIRARKAGCRNMYEISEFLDVPQNFLRDCLIRYHDRYGPSVRYAGYVIYFDPYLDIVTESDALRRQNDW